MNLFSQKNTEENNELPLSEDENTNDNAPREENSLIEILRFSIIALLIVVPVRMFIAQPFIVSGSSMLNSFHNGEYLIVDQVSYHVHSPERGDVVVFRYPKDPSKYFIKRIIGVPGDSIKIEGSEVTITNETYPNGLLLNEPYVKSMETGTNMTEKLGEREYFVMGDNRDESSDSRVWGILQEERIIGRALVRLFPPSEVGILPGVSTEEIMSSAEQNN